MSVEERLATVEHKVKENARRTNGLHEAISELGNRMERRFEAFDRRFEAIDRRFEGIERNMSGQFRWIIGIQMTTLIAMIGAIAAVAAAALGT